MALGVTFPKNEDVVAFERKNEMLVLLVSKSGTYKKELGNYAGYWLRKMFLKDLHCRGMQISRNALTHVFTNATVCWVELHLFSVLLKDLCRWNNSTMGLRDGGEVLRWAGERESGSQLEASPDHSVALLGIVNFLLPPQTQHPPPCWYYLLLHFQFSPFNSFLLFQFFHLSLVGLLLSF